MLATARPSCLMWCELTFYRYGQGTVGKNLANDALISFRLHFKTGTNDTLSVDCRPKLPVE